MSPRFFVSVLKVSPAGIPYAVWCRQVVSFRLFCFKAVGFGEIAATVVTALVALLHR